MNWHRGTDEYFIVSDPPGFVINRANTGDRITYTAVKLGKPWGGKPGDPPRGWTGSEILHVERDLDPDDSAARLAALDRCKAACRE